MSASRNPIPPRTTSSTTRVPPQPQSPQAHVPNRGSSDDDLTWLQFLRTAGGTVDNERSSQIDRKRRFAGAEHQGRTCPYPASAAASSSPVAFRAPPPPTMSAAGPASSGTAETPIDLTSPSRPVPPPEYPVRRPRRGSTQRLYSDAMPAWQPDSDVSRCPVCKIDFSFWNRRHHCRKCGRVVCAACSPHRITIPRHYIVQPPNPYQAEQDESVEAEVNRALGGGEVVRVCNPCVPDPWTPNVGGSRRDSEEGAAGARSVGDTPAGGERSERYRYNPPPPSFPRDGGRHRSQSHQPNPTPFARSVPGQGARSNLPTLPTAPTLPNFHQRPDTHARPSGHRYSHSTSTHSALPLLPPFTRDRPPIPTAPSAPPHPKPRRQVNEEDECPVCGTELPPGDQIRETHIQECIASRFSAGPSTSNATSTSVPVPATTSGTPPTPHPGTPPIPNRQRAQSYRPRGMALYRATEKDCIDGLTGDAIECVICFEEFQPGDEMGRMECLCKFHRVCIRGWWERRGVGCCPTHQLHE